MNKNTKKRIKKIISRVETIAESMASDIDVLINDLMECGFKRVKSSQYVLPINIGYKTITYIEVDVKNKKVMFNGVIVGFVEYDIDHVISKIDEAIEQYTAKGGTHDSSSV